MKMSVVLLGLSRRVSALGQDAELSSEMQVVLGRLAWEIHQVARDLQWDEDAEEAGDD